MTSSQFPVWAEEMRSIFRAGSVSQFILHGAIHDLVPYGANNQTTRFMGLESFLEEVMFGRFDLVVHYDRGTGIRASRGYDVLQKFLKSYDAWNGTQYAKSPAAIPRQPDIALGLLGRLVDWCVAQTQVVDGKPVRKPLSVALILDYAQFLAPKGDSLRVSGQHAEAVIRLQDWSCDPRLLAAGCVTVLLTESLSDLNATVSSNPYSAKIELKLPDENELTAFVEALVQQEAELQSCLKFSPELLAQRCAGLSRVNVRNAIYYAARNGTEVDAKYLAAQRRELIEKECRGLLDFIESDYTLDAVAGHGQATQWLREDAKLLRKGALRSIPMGYLFCGRIGTGKTFLTTCWAGEIGIPCVVLKNFRDKWQGSTEGNLEKIFSILKALGQVLVFVDEADQATGQRDGGGSDNGVSGRVYGMLAKQMSDTRNRGRIIWIFATSRPDLVEVDLKRPGRLDVHIPLFPPQGEDERQALFRAMAKKVGVDHRSLPVLPDVLDVGGNEMEAILVRGRRLYDLQTAKSGKKTQKQIIQDVIDEFRPMAHTNRLEFMDLLAVKECTDSRFLPSKYVDLSLDEVNSRIDALRAEIGE
jgi:hypothetical protein